MSRLQEFIWDSMNNQQLSMNQFAMKIGVASSTLSRVLSLTKPAEPSVDFLVKLAKATNTDIRDIIVMVSPDDVIHGSSGSAASLLARLNKLSDDDRELIDKYIAGALARFAKSD